MRNGVLSLDRTFDTSNNGRYNSSQYCNYSNGCNIYGSTSTLYNVEGTSLISTLAIEAGGAVYQLPSKESEIGMYLNKEYYNGLSSEARGMIKSDALYKVGVLYYDNTSMSQDIEQVNTAKWKGQVGLIDATEYVRASTNSSCTDVDSGYDTANCNNNNWMYLNDYWWTISPYSYSISQNVWYVRSSGDFNYSSVDRSNGMRPVVTLSPDVKITGGDGTSTNSYQLSL